MPLCYLGLDKATFLNIENIKKYAENNRIDNKTLMKMADHGKPGYDGPKPAGLNPNNTIRIYQLKGDFYYTIAFSIEEMSNVWIRHFSASTSTGVAPDPTVLIQLLPLFGFKSSCFKTLLVQVDKPVIHILEPRDTTWKDISEK